MTHVKVVAAALVLGTVGCASVAPKYVPAPDNVNRLRDAGFQRVKVGEFKPGDPKNPDAVNYISLRGSTYQSPYENSFVNYLREALRQDLEDARLLDPAATVEVSGVLLRNELDASISKGTAAIEARFVVKRESKVTFDKTKKASREWESSFVGAVAVPRAQQNYPTVVQELLSQLYSDPEFAAALKK